MVGEILIDTNILLRSIDDHSVDYGIARGALRALQSKILCIAPQNIMEFWAVATRRREENGLGMNHDRAEMEVREFMTIFKLLWTTPDVFEVWLNLVSRSKVTGKQTHDTHLVAVMQANQIASVLTFNGRDFARFAGINVLDPHTIN